jgi:hypothetical protein
VIFTAGDANVGKSFIMQWLSEHNILPMEYVVRIDRSYFARMMPEWPELCRRHGRPKALEHCNAEACFIEKLACEVAMNGSQHVWMAANTNSRGRREDSLLEAEIADVRQRFLSYRVAVICVTANKEIVKVRSLAPNTIARLESSECALSPSSSSTAATTPHAAQPVVGTGGFTSRGDASGLNTGANIAHRKFASADLVAHIDNNETEVRVIVLISLLVSVSSVYRCV